MREIQYQIRDELGIHARPAGMLVKEASNYQSHICLKKDDRTADMKKILNIMQMGIKKGDIIYVTAEGPDEEKAVLAIQKILEQSL